MNDRLRDLMETARERERVAMAMRQSGMTYECIGQRMGVTRERARQIVAKGEMVRRWDADPARRRDWLFVGGGRHG